VSSSVPSPDLTPAGRRRLGLAKWTEYGDAMGAWVAEHDLGAPPAVYQRLRELVDGGALGYHNAGPLVVPAYARWVEARHGWRPDPDLGLPTVNVLQGIWACIEAFTGPGDGLVITPPVYPPFHDAAPTTGRRAVHWPLVRDDDGWRYDLDALDELLASDPGIRLLVLCHPHNPTGVMLTSEELARIVAAATAHDVLIVSDEIHSDLVYPGSTHVPLLTVPGAEACTVTVSSGIKTFALGGMRCAVAQCADAGLHERLAAVPHLTIGLANRLGCEAAIAAWDTGAAWVDDLLVTLDANRRRVVDRLHAECPDVRVDLPASTFLAWLDLSAYGPGARPARWLRERSGVACGNGPRYGPGGDGHVRLTFGVTPDVLDEMLDRIVDALRSA